jgi:membrane protease YdiL (CAAX protease family)
VHAGLALVWRIYIGVFAVYALFQAIATLTESTFGEWGIPIAIAIVSACALAAAFLPLRYEGRAIDRVRALGLGAPAFSSIAVTFALSAAMLSFYPIAAASSGAALGLRPGFWALLPGLFAQAGIAEEALFRGYLFGQLRGDRSYWRAALASVPPFAIAHLYLFATMEPLLATSALLLSVAMSFPLARLYDLGGRTIWAPAILHFVVQAAPKIFVVRGMDMQLAIGWMGVAMIAPWIVFPIARRIDRG